MTRTQWQRLRRRVERAPRGRKTIAAVRLRDAVHADLRRIVEKKEQPA